jgi:hypothetical protein
MTTSPIGKKWAEALKRKYGTTKDVRRTAYVLRDGTQITYQGTGKAPHSVMAREVGANDIDHLLCATGAVRLHSWGSENDLHVCAVPTRAQQEVLTRFLYVPLREAPKALVVDVSVGNHHFAMFKGECLFEAYQRPSMRHAMKCIRDHVRGGKSSSSR